MEREDIVPESSYPIRLGSDLFDIQSDNCEIRIEDTTSQHEQLRAWKKDILIRLEQRLEDFAQYRQQAFAEIPKIAMEVIEAVLGSNDLIEQRVQEFARQAMDVAQANELEIHVHPDCIGFLRSVVQSSNKTIVLVEAPDVLPGDCRVDFGELGVDAKLANLLVAVRNRLADGEASV